MPDIWLAKQSPAQASCGKPPQRDTNILIAQDPWQKNITNSERAISRSQGIYLTLNEALQMDEMAWLVQQN